MKYYITKNENSKHGYDLIVDNNGETQTIELTRKTTDNYLHLPEQCAKDTNRKLISIVMIEKADVDMFEITAKEYKEPRKLDKSSNGSNKYKDIEQYLDDNDKVLLQKLIEKANIAREREKLMKIIAEAQSELNELNN